jgi:hypothetical protein
MPVSGQTPVRTHWEDSESVTFEKIGSPYTDPNDSTKLVQDVMAHANIGRVHSHAISSATIDQDDMGYSVILDDTSPASAISVSLDSSVDDRFMCFVLNESTQTVTLTPTSGDINDGTGSASNKTLAAGTSCALFKTSSGSPSTANWKMLKGAGSGGGGGSSPLTTKGDLFVYDTADARLAVGSNNQVVLADSSQAKGIKWGAVDESVISLSDVTTLNASTSQHGFLKKLPNDVTQVMRGDGTWGGVAGGGSGSATFFPTMTPPVSTDFAWVNQLSTSVTDFSNRMRFSLPTNGTDPNWRLFVANAALPSPPYTVIAAFSRPVLDSNYLEMTIGIRNSSSGKFVDLNLNMNGAIGLRRITFNSVTSVSGVQTLYGAVTQSSLIFLKITDDGTTRKYHISNNGWDYQTSSFTESTGTFITPDQCYIGCANLTGLTYVFSVFHWQVANSVI